MYKCAGEAQQHGNELQEPNKFFIFIMLPTKDPTFNFTGSFVAFRWCCQTILMHRTFHAKEKFIVRDCKILSNLVWHCNFTRAIRPPRLKKGLRHIYSVQCLHPCAASSGAMPPGGMGSLEPPSHRKYSQNTTHTPPA